MMLTSLRYSNPLRTIHLVRLKSDKVAGFHVRRFALDICNMESLLFRGFVE
jgi:hypothetical protein